MVGDGDVDVIDVVVDVDDVEVSAGVDLSDLVRFTTANTSATISAAVSTPRPTSAAGCWYQGGRGGSGCAGW